MSDTEALGQKIRAARVRKHLSLFKAGATAGVDPSHWSRVELGKANPSLATVRRMAAAVGLRDIVAALGGSNVRGAELHVILRRPRPDEGV